MAEPLPKYFWPGLIGGLVSVAAHGLFVSIPIAETIPIIEWAGMLAWWSLLLSGVLWIIIGKHPVCRMVLYAALSLIWFVVSFILCRIWEILSSLVVIHH